MTDTPESSGSNQGTAQDNHKSQYFLHHGESPGLVLVSQPLTFQNYHSRNRAMYVALSAKNKLGFIDGTIAKPQSTDPLCHSWLRCSHMILSWISNSLSTKIAGSILFSDSVAEVWTDLKISFARSSNTRVYILEQQLATTRQEHSPVSVYFSKLELLWDETQIYDDHFSCTTVNCGAIATLCKKQEKRYILQFLMGLNEHYSHIRSQVLLKDPLPTLDDVFNLILQEKPHKELTTSLQSPVESAALISRMERPQKEQQRNFQKQNKPQQGQKGKLFCTKCKRDNHTVDTCFEIHGYPPGYKSGRGRQAYSSNRNTYGSIAGTANQAISSGEGSSNMGPQLPITQEQCQQLLSFLQSQKISQPASSSVNQVSTQQPLTLAPMTGPGELENDWDY